MPICWRNTKATFLYFSEVAIIPQSANYASMTSDVIMGYETRKTARTTW